MIQPLEATDEIRHAYLRYLQSSYPFQRSDLREKFREEISAPNALVKGPLLESTPPFQTGRSIAGLVEEGVLHNLFSELCSKALPYERPLYIHQQEAVRKVAAEGRNLVVATGTGSGKTETFLLPLLNHLLREQEAGTLSTPGVRVLLLYPMNALVNDQLTRLRGILEDTPFPITFGRYTGETAYEREEAEENFKAQFRGEPIIDNELLFRNEMRENPPHILVTNYAMLEYLLLRPEDHIFFDNDAGTWKFLVLDEAHTYDGATGIELGMLIRRLKERIDAPSLSCMATSATIGGGREDFPDVATFASNLFGESFQWNEENPAQQDVVSATRRDVNHEGRTWGAGTPSFYSNLYEGLQTAVDSTYQRDENEDFDVDNEWVTGKSETVSSRTRSPIEALAAAADGCAPDELIKEAREAAQESADPGIQAGRFLHHLLVGDSRLRRLKKKLSEEPHDVREVSRIIFPKADDPDEALVHLVSVAVRARLGRDKAPLLPARYHVFAKALEGAFACLNRQGHNDSEAWLSLKRRETCPHCEGDVQELASCKFCGATYVVARKERGDRASHYTLSHIELRPDEQQKERSYFLLESEVAAPDEDRDITSETDSSLPDAEKYTLCTGCGTMAQGVALHCTCEHSEQITVNELAVEGGEPPRECIACGKRSSRSVLYRFLTGQDAPVSVLATGLYQQLPPARDPKLRGQPGEGRKLLAFADSRQDAAFFAPFMQRTYDQLLHRRLILKALRENSEAREGRLRMPDVVTPLVRTAESEGVFSTNESGYQRKMTAKKWLMGELVAWDHQQSLEGVGLLRFDLAFPKDWDSPTPLLRSPWGLSHDEAKSLISTLLDSLRRQSAVTFPEGVDPRDDYFEPRNRSFSVSAHHSDRKRGVLSWLPVQGTNRRLDYLGRVLENKAPELSHSKRTKIARKTLQGIWKHLTSSQIWESHWSRESGNGVTYTLRNDYWHLTPLDSPEGFQCSRCGRMTTHSVAKVCPSISCSGSLKPLTSAPRATDHYRTLYQGMEPIPLKAEEHTAQWKNQKASEIQSQFIQGKINLLSCSTTFELGVDVGDLQAVLLRNVPPSTANYVQRAGRAGRRTDAAAFALTFAQRRSHDLTHYARPERLVGGHVEPPRITIANEKIVRRHMQAVLIAAFLWKEKEHFGYNPYEKVEDFFLSTSEDAETTGTGIDRFREYAEKHPEEVKRALSEIIPASHDLPAQVGLENWSWLRTAEEDGMLDLLDRIEGEVTGDVEVYQNLIDRALEKENYRQADVYKRVLRTVENRRLISFAASRGLLPKYGFPTDVVNLRTEHVPSSNSRNIELQRDLRIAIGEYAPGSEVVAAGKVWKGGGLQKLPNKNWPTYKYAVCPECNRFYQDPDEIPQTCKGCGESLRKGYPRRYGTYVIPEFGFVAAPASRKTGESSPQRGYASRVYFDDYEGDYPDLEAVGDLCSGQTLVQSRHSRFGRLVVVNNGPEGNGFRICHHCGYGAPAPSQRGDGAGTEEHRNPRTQDSCSGTLYHYHLGHSFLTDVTEFRVDDPDVRVTRSLLYALLEGAAHSLGIRRDDIDGTLYWTGNANRPSLVLFDNVPGGAGHARRIAEEAPKVFGKALEIVSRECCGPETSCYECLRTYRNQTYHEELCRGEAQAALEVILA